MRGVAYFTEPVLCLEVVWAPCVAGIFIFMKQNAVYKILVEDLQANRQGTNPGFISDSLSPTSVHLHGIRGYLLTRCPYRASWGTLVED